MLSLSGKVERIKKYQTIFAIRILITQNYGFNEEIYTQMNRIIQIFAIF